MCLNTNQRNKYFSQMLSSKADGPMKVNYTRSLSCWVSKEHRFSAVSLLLFALMQWSLDWCFIIKSSNTSKKRNIVTIHSLRNQNFQRNRHVSKAKKPHWFAKPSILISFKNIGLYKWQSSYLRHTTCPSRIHGSFISCHLLIIQCHLQILHMCISLNTEVSIFLKMSCEPTSGRCVRTAVVTSWRDFPVSTTVKLYLFADVTIRSMLENKSTVTSSSKFCI